MQAANFFAQRKFVLFFTFCLFLAFSESGQPGVEIMLATHSLINIGLMLNSLEMFWLI